MRREPLVLTVILADEFAGEMRERVGFGIEILNNKKNPNGGHNKEHCGCNTEGGVLHIYPKWNGEDAKGYGDDGPCIYDADIETGSFINKPKKPR